MESAFNLTEIRMMLRRGIESGRWTMQDLDQPPPGYVLFIKEWKLCCEKQSQLLGIPVQYPLVQYKNLLRDEPPSVGAGTVEDF